MAVGASNGGNKFAILHGGYMAMVPPRARSGDVAILLGEKEPYLFRKSGMLGDQASYELVGKCYVHGLTAAKLEEEGMRSESIRIF